MVVFYWLASVQILCMFAPLLWVYMCIGSPVICFMFVIYGNDISLELSITSSTEKLDAFLFAQISESWGKGFDQTSHPKSPTLRTLSNSGSLKISSSTARISFSDKGWVVRLSIARCHLESVNCYVCFQIFYIESHMKTTFHISYFKRLRIIVSLSQVSSITVGSWRQCVEKISMTVFQSSLWTDSCHMHLWAKIS